ncbi:MAG: apolipoprotein N-acyltransferase, partial [Gemmatimonadetes bacterium]|nr:apolipoprotein N-acyltransferase [Gemmatimonadota bacterium]
TALHRLTHRARPVPLALALPASWTALEWALGHLPFGWAFPWAPLGLGLARWPGTIGIAELIGVGGVTAWLAAVSGMTGQAAAAWADRGWGRGRRGALLLAGAVLLALAPIGWSRARLRTLPVRAVGRVAAVALAVPPRAPAAARAEMGVAQTENALAALTDPGVALVVLPEMTLPLDPAAPAGEPFRARLAAAAASLGAPLLVGVLGVAGGQEYNSALLLGGGGTDGAPAFRADKRRLVPGVERVSAVHAPWLAPSRAGYDPGEGWPVARFGGMGVGALVCYEVAFAQDARLLVAGGADVLAVVTSDAWFGEGALRRAGIAQQTAHLTMRVLETRTGAVRASNGGPALVIAPTGRVVAAADAGAVVGPVGAVERPTLFVRTGDLAGPAAAVVLLALLLVE